MSRRPELSAALVRKGEAAPSSPERAIATPPVAAHAPTEEVTQTILAEPERVAPEPALEAPQPQTPLPRTHRPSARRPAPAPVEADPVLDPEEPRTAVTTRLKISVQERIRVLAFRRRITKQSIIDDAVAEYLDRHGG